MIDIEIYKELLREEEEWGVIEYDNFTVIVRRR